MISYEIRLIEWIDSAGMPGWNESKEIADHSVADCVSVGFVVKEDETQVLLALGVDRTNGNVDDVIAIPKVAVVSERTLRTKKEAARV